ncbi:MAG: 3-deoxy-7-phosphoheptulonate synthase [Clostridiales bacterium]|nr:3-deoxy-7-phosphoheptulonate synthase [Clostridiales bacterium]
MYQRVRKLISVSEAKKLYPIDFSASKIDFDNKIKEIISGKGRFLLIIGPCSADNHDAVLKYCEHLKRISEKVQDKIFIVPRIYTTKPRSEAGAYRGILHSPNCESEDINKGILSARQLMIDVAKNFDFFAADEMLYPNLYMYFDDLLSYITIGARSSEDQLHRLAASGLDVAVGIKNPMHGNLKSLAQAIKTASLSNHFTLNGYEIVSSGNRSAHAILRGFIDSNGKMQANYTRGYIDKFAFECSELDINPAIIIDCNHANSGKNCLMEPQIAMDVVNTPQNRSIVKGLMIESYLLDGKQSKPIEFGKSLTDECLGIEKTEKLIYDIAEKL